MNLDIIDTHSDSHDGILQWTNDCGILFNDGGFTRHERFFRRCIDSVTLPVKLPLSHQDLQNTPQRLSSIAAERGGNLPEYHPDVLVKHLVAGKFLADTLVDL